MSLLRFLPDGEVKPVGSDRAKQTNVRIIAASNRPVRQRVDEGRFRRDLSPQGHGSRSIPSVVLLGQVKSALCEPRSVEHGLPTAAVGRFVASADRPSPWTTLHSSARMALDCRELAL